MSPFALLKITDTLFGAAFQFKYLFGDFVKYFSGIGQGQFFTDMVNELNVVKFLQSLDALVTAGWEIKSSFAARLRFPFLAAI